MEESFVYFESVIFCTQLKLRFFSFLQVIEYFYMWVLSLCLRG